MFIELVDALRCPNSHEESWLVAAATRMESRHIVEGTIGCPVCAAEFPVHQGVVDFRTSPTAVAGAESPSASDDTPMRLAALLDLTDARGFAVLMGTWGAYAPALAGVTETPLVVVDPPQGVVGAPGISVLRCDGAVPLAAGAARAMAIDAGDDARIASAVRATRTKGRLLGPSGMALPAGVGELARDANMWVGEREPASSPVVTLHVRRAAPG